MGASEGEGGGGGRIQSKIWAVYFLNEEVTDCIHEVKSPACCEVVLSISKNGSALFPAFDSQVVKEVGGMRSAK